MNHVNPDDLLLFHYGESDDADAIRAHLAECGLCCAELETLRQMFAAVNSVDVPERAADYEATVWEGVRHRLGVAPIRKVRVAPHRRWAWAAGIAASILLAFMLGRYWPSIPESKRAASPTNDAVERVLAGALATHLERTAVLLTDVVNVSGNGTVALGFRRDRATELVEDNRLLRQTASRHGMRSVTVLLDELERVLIEVANSAPELPSDQYENIRESIEEQDLLFKVRVTGDRMQRDGSEKRPGTTI